LEAKNGMNYVNVHLLLKLFFTLGTRGQKGKPGVKGNPGHFAMKFINLRRPGSKPVFVVLPSENKKYTFYINNVKVRSCLLHYSGTFSPVNNSLFLIARKNSYNKFCGFTVQYYVLSKPCTYSSHI
jgi:hypothetical protein